MILQHTLDEHVHVNITKYIIYQDTVSSWMFGLELLYWGRGDTSELLPKPGISISTVGVCIPNTEDWAIYIYMSPHWLN